MKRFLIKGNQDEPCCSRSLDIQIQDSKNTIDSDTRSSSSSAECSVEHEGVPKKKLVTKKIYKQKFKKEWSQKDKNKVSWLRKTAKNESFCDVCTRIIRGGITHLNRHQESKGHQSRMKLKKSSVSLDNFVTDNQEKKVEEGIRSGHIKLIMCLAEHNLPFKLLDHLIQLIRSVCFDSEIGKRLQLGRHKGTLLCKEIAIVKHRRLVETLNQTKFSLIIDETTDVSTKKCLVLVARYFSEESCSVTDSFLALIEATICSGEGLFTTIINFFNSSGIKITNLIGFAADNCSVMMSDKVGVQRRFKDILPHLYVVGCICHSLHLCASAACSNLPKSIEQLTRDIYSYFAHSAKRYQNYSEFQIFANVKPYKLLKLSQTRWLSLKCVVDRILNQWEALKLFFINESLVEKVLDAKSISEALHNHSFKMYFYFLSYILEYVNNLNLEFQSESFRLHVLLPRMRSVFKTILKCFMKEKYIETIDSTNKLNEVKFIPENYLPLEETYVGAKCQVFILEKNVDDKDVRDFKLHCLKFYVEICKQIINRFNFADPVLLLLTHLDPKLIKNEKNWILNLYLRFPNIIDQNNVELLNTELRILIEQDIDTTLKPEIFWSGVFKLKNSLNEPMFPVLSKFIKSILSLPHSSAAAERKFSQLNLIKNKTRNRLLTSTCESLMHTKDFLNNNNCYQFTCDKDLRSLNVSWNKEKKDDNDVEVTF